MLDSWHMHAPVSNFSGIPRSVLRSGPLALLLRR
jgi:hypothetical protein